MLRTFWQACREWSNDNAAFLGAALAYYSLFSIGPLLLLTIAIAGMAFGDAAAQGRVFDFLKDYLGETSAHAVQKLVLTSKPPSFSSWSSVVATAVLVYLALSLFRNLKTALGMVWKLPPISHSGIVTFIYDSLLAIILVLLTGLFIFFLTAMSMVNAYLRDLPTIERFGPWAWRSLDFAAVTLLQVFVLVLTYRMLSEGRIAYRHIWGGAIVAALLLSFGKLAFTVYLSFSALDNLYGAAGSIVVFMLWIYYSAQIVFFGAEIIKVRKQRGG